MSIFYSEFFCICFFKYFVFYSFYFFFYGKILNDVCYEMALIVFGDFLNFREDIWDFYWYVYIIFDIYLFR